VIDRADFDTHSSASGDTIRRAESRHAAYHVRWANLRSDKDICQFQNSQRTP
jgi:hypothetical protein